MEYIHYKKFVERYQSSGIETPCFIYISDRIIENIEILTNKYKQKSIQVEFAYAIKACSLIPILKLINSKIEKFEIQSRYEAEICINAGIASKNLIWNSPRKSKTDIEFAINNGISVIIDNYSEGIDFLELSDEKNCTNFGVRQSSTNTNSFIRKNHKLGFLFDDLTRFLELCIEKGKYPNIFHYHTLARCDSVEDFSVHIDSAISSLNYIHENYGYTFPILNLGGGWDCNTRLQRKGLRSSDFVDLTTRKIENLNYKPRSVFFEIGRNFIEDTAVVACKIVRIKKIEDVYWLVVDVVTNLLVPIPLARFEVADLHKEKTEKFSSVICDGTCSPNGIIVESCLLPRMNEGDILYIINCGAYTTSLIEPFMEPPANIVLFQNDNFEIVIGNEQMRDIVDKFHG